MEPLQFNIKYIRQQKGMTQQAFAEHLGIKRSVLGAYEEGRARPKVFIQQEIARIAGITLDELLTKDLSDNGLRISGELSSKQDNPDVTGQHLRVLSKTIDKWGHDNIEVVSVKAETGYLEGYKDPEYLRGLPKCQLPFLSDGTYRTFEVKDEAMPPLQPGAYVVGRYVTDWRNIEDNETVIVVTKTHGIMYRRYHKQIQTSNIIQLHPDHASFQSIHVPVEDLLEMWQGTMVILPTTSARGMSQQELTNMVLELQQEVLRLQRKINE